MGTLASTTLVIDFGETEQGSIAAALDSEKNGGNATFGPGDVIHFRVWAASDYAVKATSGVLVKNTTSTKATDTIEDEIITFTGSNMTNAQFFVKSITSQEWFGTSLGTLTAGKYNNINVATTEKNPIGAAQIDYITEFDEWQITAPAYTSDSYAIVIFIQALK